MCVSLIINNIQYIPSAQLNMLVVVVYIEINTDGTQNVNIFNIFRLITYP